MSKLDNLVPIQYLRRELTGALPNLRDNYILFAWFKMRQIHGGWTSKVCEFGDQETWT